MRAILSPAPILATCVAALLNAPTIAQAHIGHLGDFAGHDHWVAAGALGLAGLVAIYGAMKGKKDQPKAQDPQDPDQEASA